MAATYEIHIQGVVQGVGFRPFVYRLAKKLGVDGIVRNTQEGVFIRLSCTKSFIHDFISSLQHDVPPRACIRSIRWDETEPISYTDFTIEESRASASQEGSIPKDSAVCEDCRRELFDPRDRRFGYPFISCTNCGPRYTIIESLPYDRPHTSMRSFPLCSACRAEYSDPMNRRFHAQPIGCWSCGPVLSWHDAQGQLLAVVDCFQEAKKQLADGKILAVKGLGGFHLVVDAMNEAAVMRLRQKKKRAAKPFAVMLPSLPAVMEWCRARPEEEQILSSPECPIVLLPKKNVRMLPECVAPGVAELGVMLPYTPIHHLLFSDGLQALIMTSGNRSGEPICIDNDEAVEALAGIADFFLMHNRPIVTRLDDSLVRFAAGKMRVLRRARGYVPEPFPLPAGKDALLACGAALKSTFTLTREDEGVISQYLGDLDTASNRRWYEESIAHMQEIHGIRPQRFVCDLHPDYISSRFAHKQGASVLSLQHHHAHAAAVAAEHALTCDYYAVVLDGTGLGPDGTIWGGEFLACSGTEYERLGHIEHLALPGGDAAAREPWRMAVALMHMLYGSTLSCKQIGAALPTIETSKSAFLLQMLEQGVQCPQTSSCGRLFDAVSALVTATMVNEFEGQAAMALEALAWKEIGNRSLAEVLSENDVLATGCVKMDEGYILAIRPFAEHLMSTRIEGHTAKILAVQFHLWLIHAIVDIVVQVCCKQGKRPVVLTGGCMQNRLLFEGLCLLLGQNDIDLYSGESIPVNDAGISVGQAFLGGMVDVSCYTHGST